MVKWSNLSWLSFQLSINSFHFSCSNSSSALLTWNNQLHSQTFLSENAAANRLFSSSKNDPSGCSAHPQVAANNSPRCTLSRLILLLKAESAGRSAKVCRWMKAEQFDTCQWNCQARREFASGLCAGWHPVITQQHISVMSDEILAVGNPLAVWVNPNGGTTTAPCFISTELRDTKDTFVEFNVLCDDIKLNLLFFSVLLLLVVVLTGSDGQHSEMWNVSWDLRDLDQARLKCDLRGIYHVTSDFSVLFVLM